MNYASIVPLIGGETFGMQEVFGQKPDYILSYSDFEANDRQLLNYYNNSVPYYKLDQGGSAPHRVDVINTVCPCAGLSSLSPTSSASNTTNDWMVKSAQYILEEVQPTVFWGENAPRLASKMGEPIVNKLRKIGKDNGYTMTLYKTKSLLHGLSQVRDRCFYFFWKGNHVPVFAYYNILLRESIEDTIRSSSSNQIDEMYDMQAKTSKPSDDPYYKYVLEEIEDGITHQDFFKKIKKTTNPLDYIEQKGIKYNTVAKWMKMKGYDKYEVKCQRMHEKLESGGNIMRKATTIAKDYIGAFVGNMATDITHPDVDRYINVREALDIMKMPKDFQLQGGTKNINMICQNVPVTTARDMAFNVSAYLGGHLTTHKSDFAVQDNKTTKFWREPEPSTLEEFL